MKAFVTLVISLVGWCILLANSQENAQTRVPESLIDCYRNVTLNHREFRPPMTIATLIEIIRKIENYPGTNMDMRALTISLLHRFRLDGIEMSSDVASTEGVTPFSVKGYQFFKHRIILRNFMQGTAVQFPNASLTTIEQCALHFLVSNSLDRGQRGDEGRVCNQISSYQDRRRAPRSVDNVPVPPTADLTDKPVPDSEVEFVNVNNLQPTSNTNNTNTNTPDKAGKMFLDDDNADLIQATSRQKQSSSSSISSSRPKPIPPISPRVIQPKVTTTVTESDCPVENGAILTPYGSIQAGTLLAGIAAGLQPGDVKTTLLNTKISRLINVQNIWAATLAGDLAELALLQGPRYGDNMKMGLVGGWNSTSLPRWYFTTSQNGQDQMTDAEIRGGLDGLIIAKHIVDWNSKAGNRLKLSQVLDMYYSTRGVFGDPVYRACARKSIYTEVAPSSELEEQTEGFALILDPQMISEAQLDEEAIKRFAVTAANKLNNYIPSELKQDSCPEAIRSRLTGSQNVKPSAELYIVFDAGWQYVDIQPIITGIINSIGLGIYESNITLITGKDKEVILNSTNSLVEYATNFSQARYANLQAGMDVPGALQTELKELFEDKMEIEKRNNVAGGRPMIVLFIPNMGHTLSDSDNRVAEEAVKYFRERIPDVKFMYMAQSSSSRYNKLVEDPTKDLFGLQIGEDAATIDATVAPFAARMREMHRRIINPTCGRDWKTQAYSFSNENAYLEPKSITYYRVHPNYFFASGYAKIKFQGYNTGELRVCYSRRNEYPNNSTTGSDGVTCQQLRSETIEIKLDTPCNGYTFVSQCPALYIAVEDTGSNLKYECYDAECPNIDYIKYTISSEGLTCRGGIGRVLENPGLIAFTSLLIIAFKNLFNSY